MCWTESEILRYFFCCHAYRNNCTVLIWSDQKSQISLSGKTGQGDFTCDISFWFWLDINIYFEHQTAIVLVVCEKNELLCFTKFLTVSPAFVSHLTSVIQTNAYLTHPMHCLSTGPERSLLVHPSQSHLSPRTSYQLATATRPQDKREKNEVK